MRSIPLNIESSGWEKLLKGSGMIVLIYGSLLIIGGASGSRSIWQPLHGPNYGISKQTVVSVRMASPLLK